MRAFRGVPLIDLSGDPLLVGKALRRACTEVGFFQLIGHNVPTALTNGILREASDFFARPQAEKEQISIRNSSTYRGYQRVHENVTGNKPDSHEAIDLYSESPLAHRASGGHFGRNQWPLHPAGLQPTVEAYVHEMSRVGTTIMQALAGSLELPRDHFQPFYNDPFWCVRLIRYEPSNHHLGVGTHTDYGCLTLVHADDTPAMLQAQNIDGEWITVEPVPGAFTCNVGDMLARWTNGLFASTPHRVLPPPEGSSRISVPFFFEP
mmetsp:Transcript_73790/g.164012  ORF Transcript_73790/g.164012 Transcript_73790/m.164012 type:complete len:264 (+) Transcript_73790:22-813(+)